MRRISILAGGLVAVVAAAGCGGGSSKPTIKITSPSNNATAAGGTVTATVSPKNFKLNGADVGKKPIKGEGHLHFSMDDGKYDFPKYSGANGQLAVKLGVQGKYSPSVTSSITYTGLPAGKHTLEVYLANNDHSNVGPSADVSITVK